MKFVRKLQEQEQEIVVIKTDGEVVRGYIRAADAETISLRCYLNGDKTVVIVRVFFSNTKFPSSHQLRGLKT